MINKKVILPFILFFAITAFFFVSPKPASAFSFGDFFNGIKTFATAPFIKVDLSIDSEIELVSGGDLNKNGVIDSGDTVKYSFKITNLTDKTFTDSKLNTNVSTNDINTISNIKGTVSLDDSKKTVTIPNLTFTPNQFRKVSFEAKVNYFKDSDKTLSAEGELIDDTNKSLHKAEKKNISVKKLDEEKFNKLLNTSQQ